MPGYTSLSRVTESSLTIGLQSSLQKRLQALSEQERQISSGRKFQQLSDAPLSTRRIVSWTRMVERTEKFEANVQLADSRLAAAESALTEMENIIIRAREIALTQINGSSTAGTRANSATEISFLIDEMVTLANRQFGERYLFAGNELNGSPFERVGNFVSYEGDDGESSVEIAPGMFHADSISGVKGLGAWSTEILGREDLNPVLRLDTPLRTINDGRGFEAGRIEVRDGTDREFIDLTGAKTIGDVIDRINDSGFVTAALNASLTGLELTKVGANLSVYDVNGGSAASDLGVAQVLQGAAITGLDLDPPLTGTTLLADLRGGAGITPGDFMISNGTLTATIDTTAMATVEDLLNAIHASGTSVVARISQNNNSLELFSSLSGADMVVMEGSTTTATELGLRIPSADVEIDRLNGGHGVSVLDGNDFRITLADGTNIDIDASDAATLGDIAALINNSDENGGLLLAEVVDGEDRLRLTELSGAPGELTVTQFNGSFSASDLGILGSSTGGVLEGNDLSPGAIRTDSVFDGLSILYEGLMGDDPSLMSRALRSFDKAEVTLLRTRAEIGTSIRRLEISSRRTELEVLETQNLISQEGDTDLAEAILNFNREQSVLQAALQTGSRILQQSILDFLS